MPVGVRTSRTRASRGSTRSEGQAPSTEVNQQALRGAGRDRQGASEWSGRVPGGSPSPGLGAPVLPVPPPPTRKQGKSVTSPHKLSRASVTARLEIPGGPSSVSFSHQGVRRTPRALDVVFASVNSCPSAAPRCRNTMGAPAPPRLCSAQSPAFPHLRASAVRCPLAGSAAGAACTRARGRNAL